MSCNDDGHQAYVAFTTNLEPKFQEFVTKEFQMAGVYNFVTIVCESIAVIILTFDERKDTDAAG